MQPTLCYFVSSVGWWIVHIDFTINFGNTLACFTSVANFVPASFVLANFSSHTSWHICCRWLCWHEVFFKIYQVNLSFYTYTPPSGTCVLVVFHSISLMVIHQNVLHCADGVVTLCLIFFLHTIIHTCHLISLIRIQHIPLSWLPSSTQNHQHQTLGVFCVTNYYIIIFLVVCTCH